MTSCISDCRCRRSLIRTFSRSLDYSRFTTRDKRKSRLESVSRYQVMIKLFGTWKSGSNR